MSPFSAVTAEWDDRNDGDKREQLRREGIWYNSGHGLFSRGTE